MSWTDEIRIETPEQIEVGMEPAGLGTRFVAQLFDWLMKVLGTALLVLAAALVAAFFGVSLPERQMPVVVIAVLVGVGYLLWFAYDLLYESARNGQTPGKRVAGIRVIREGGAPVDFQAAAVRNLLGLADLLPGFYILGAFIILLTPKRQRLGDLAAGTIVVRERVAAAPAETDATIRELASPDYAFAARHLTACTANDRHVLRSFLRRQKTMAPAARDVLARRLAAVFLEKTAFEPQRPLGTGGECVGFLASLLRDLAIHDGRTL